MMGKIAQMVRMLDVPAEAGDSFLTNTNKLQPYTLSGSDPEVLIKSITDLCVLEPQTKLYVMDKKKPHVRCVCFAARSSDDSRTREN